MPPSVQRPEASADTAFQPPRTPEFLVQRCQVAQDIDNLIRVHKGWRLLVDAQDLLVEGLGLRVLSLLGREIRQAVQAERERGMLWFKERFLDPQRSLIIRPGFGVLPLLGIEVGEVMLALSDIKMLRSQRLLPDV